MKVLTRMNVTIEVVDMQPYSEDELVKNIRSSAIKHAEGEIRILLQKEHHIRQIGETEVVIVAIEDDE